MVLCGATGVSILVILAASPDHNAPNRREHQLPAHRGVGTLAEPCYDVVHQLVAGARVEDGWLADEHVSSDLQLLAALTRDKPS